MLVDECPTAMPANFSQEEIDDFIQQYGKNYECVNIISH
jgi:hypothetical protein